MSTVITNEIYLVEQGTTVSENTLMGGTEIRFVTLKDMGPMFGKNIPFANPVLGINTPPGGKIYNITKYILPETAADVQDLVRCVFDSANYQAAKTWWLKIKAELNNPSNFVHDKVNGTYRVIVNTMVSQLPVLISHLHRFALADGFDNLNFNMDAGHITAIWEFPA